MTPGNVYIVAGARTPMADYVGALKDDIGRGHV